MFTTLPPRANIPLRAQCASTLEIRGRWASKKNTDTFANTGSISQTHNAAPNLIPLRQLVKKIQQKIKMSMKQAEKTE